MVGFVTGYSRGGLSRPKRARLRLWLGKGKFVWANSLKRFDLHTIFLAPPTASSLPPALLAEPTMAGSDNPFKNADAWRKHPLLNGTWKHIAPGFFIGLTAFGVFYAYDKATTKKTAKH